LFIKIVKQAKKIFVVLIFHFNPLTINFLYFPLSQSLFAAFLFHVVRPFDKLIRLYRIGDIKATLDHLIDYYRTHPIIMITHEGQSPVLLANPVPDTQLFKVQDWYIPELNDIMTVQ
jgi:hypothetical protein